MTYQIDSDDIFDFFGLFLRGPLNMRFFVARSTAVRDLIQVRARLGELEKTHVKLPTRASIFCKLDPQVTHFFRIALFTKRCHRREIVQKDTGTMERADPLGIRGIDDANEDRHRPDQDAVDPPTFGGHGRRHGIRRHEHTGEHKAAHG